MHAPLPLTRDIVLIGGGHTHALLLKRWGMDPLAGARLTLINPGPTAPYTGMLPGYVAGHYSREALEIDLMRLARFAGARMILGRATGIDRAAGEIAVEDEILGPRRIGYDVASLDIGIHSEMPDLDGFAAHAVPAKPLARLAERWSAYRETGDPGDGMAVIGGGVAGIELAMALSYGLDRGHAAPVTVIEAGTALSDVSAGARRRLLAEAERQAVTILENVRAVRVTAAGVDLEDGRHVPARFVTGAAGARPHGWLAETGLELHAGAVAVGPRLQSSDPAIFAAGDCAHLSHAPRPKAGVFAVRQAPVLAANLRAAVGGGRWSRYAPQKGYLKLVSLGRQSAVADRGRMAWSGDWLWRLKDRIDAKFMAGLSDLTPMAGPELPRHRADGVEPLTRQAPCGGCGAKVGQSVLSDALARAPRTSRADVETGPGDDAAVVRMGETRQVLTVDQLRAFTPDPGLLAHIAAHHAMGDCLAMAAAPQVALSTLTLPRLSPRLEARWLDEIAQAAGAVFGAAGAEIVGGHTATGPELSVGFTVTGLLPRAPVTLAGARPGAALILTKPLGTGVILAAEMALRARGDWTARCLREMARPQIAAAGILAEAQAMTDVTGFGLAGHLMGMLRASGVSAELLLADLPLLPGALESLEAGMRSTLHEANQWVMPDVSGADTIRAQILYDPQTAGGLLAAVPEVEADRLLAELHAAGAPAVRIGTLTEGRPSIRLV